MAAPTTVQLNLGTASREEIVDFLKKQNGKVKEVQNQLKEQKQREEMRVSELEDQLHCVTQQGALMKGEMNDLRAANKKLVSAAPPEGAGDMIQMIEPLQQQIGILSDKIATDAELIVHLERELADRSNPPTVQESRNDENTPPPNVRSRTSSVINVTSVNNEILEQRILELEAEKSELHDTNNFYTSVVSQQDADDAAKGAQIVALSTEVVDLKKKISSCPGCLAQNSRAEEAENQLAQVEKSFASLREQHFSLKRAYSKDQGRLLELDAGLRRNEENQDRLVASMEADVAGIRHGFDSDLVVATAASAAAAVAAASPTAVGSGSARLPVESASSSDLTSSFAVSGGRPSTPPPSARGTQQAVVINAGTPMMSGVPSATRQPSLNNVPVVPKVRNPTKRELQLIERMEQFDEQLQLWIGYEQVKQKNLDEVERNRADLFLAMNKELEDKKKELGDLKAEKRQGLNEDSNTTSDRGETLQLQEDVHTLQAQLSSLQIALETEQASNATQKDHLDAAQCRVSTLETEKQEREHRVSSIVGQVRGLKDREAQLISENDALKAQAENSSKRAEVGDVEHTFRQLETEHQQQQAQAQEALQQAVGKVQALEGVVAKMESELERQVALRNNAVDGQFKPPNSAPFQPPSPPPQSSNVAADAERDLKLLDEVMALMGQAPTSNPVSGSASVSSSGIVPNSAAHVPEPPLSSSRRHDASDENGTTGTSNQSREGSSVAITRTGSVPFSLDDA